MNKEEYYTRMKKIQNKLSTDRCSIDEEHNLIVQKCYLKDKYIETCEQQLDQLTNNWNELEEWAESNLGNCRTNIKYEIGNEYIIKENVYYKVLDKMKEIKEKNNEK